MAMDFTKTVLGIELGSTRIKAVLLDEKHIPVASGAFEWENKLVNGVWTYSLDAVHTGVTACYADLMEDVKRKFGAYPATFGAIGVSGMMHGYLPFDAEGKQLAEFRTWRNTMTAEAAAQLSEALHFAVPQRWSVAHVYQAILNGEEHVSRIARLTTVAGYIHYLLTGCHVMGIGEASGMFPIDSAACDYDQTMVNTFDALLAEKNIPWKLREVFPKVLVAGQPAGTLTASGAAFLDPTGTLQPGVPLCPPEGDAGTGMTATNSVRVRTGNVSAGTSDFAMIVTDHPLGVHKEINMVTTPAGDAVAMVHCSNCTSDINAWVGLFGQFAEAIGAPQDKGKLFTMLFNKAMEGDPDCGGLLSYNYFSGEGVTGVDEGCPVFVRKPDANFTLANFMRAHLLSALSTLKIGLDILTTEENVAVDKIYGHGGFFKTPGVGQTMLSAAIGAPVSVMETAGEGGPYGMALLASFMLNRAEGESLADYLDNRVFADAKSSTVMATDADIIGFNSFLIKYIRSFGIEREAIATF